MVNIYNIPSEKSFLDVLAISLLQETEFNPTKLQEYIILLPTRRACTSLKEAFLKYSQEKALILPTINPIGDAFDYDDIFWLNSIPETDDEPYPPISLMKRLMVLSNLVMEKAKAQKINMSPHTAFILSKELASLLDEVVVENLSWDNLKNIIPENLNTYWQEILTFLQIVSEIYPNYLKEQKLSDIKEYQLYKIKKLGQLWQKTPPKNKKIIAAGNTATQPVISDFLKVIANMENGCVILPGLDTLSSDEDFSTYNEGHYQYGLKRFLNKLEIPRTSVKEWGQNINVSTINKDRQRLVVEILKPIELTQNWRFTEEFSDSCLDNIYKINCNDEREEALAIALIMRKTLETPEKTAALVTSDVNLGKRVSLELERFNIKINNSAGLSLSQTPVGAYFNLVLNFCTTPSPVSLLALLKHPFTSAGLGEECRNIARLFDKKLRGKIKVFSLEDIRESLEDEELKLNFDKIITLSNPLLEIKGLECELSDIITKHIEVAEKLATTPERLWQGSDGIANSSMFSQVLQDAKEFFSITLEDYAKLLLQFQTQLVRNPYNTHKRLEILGPMEARLQHKDIMILGSLNEGIFPKTEEAGPWMSYQMRYDFGLPSGKQRLGISGSDFANCFMAPEVYLTRSLKSAGTPTIASRWLQRLEAVINVAGKKALEKSSWDKTNWCEITKLIDTPEKRIKISPTWANPDISIRPKKMSVSAIETLMKDPYSFYVKYILRIKPLELLEPKITAQGYGSAVHEIFAWFVKNYQNIPENALEIIHNKAKEVFKREGISLFWLMRFNRASNWLIEELNKREENTTSHVEVSGKINIEGIDVTAIADRIDVNNEKSTIIDYKTGSPPNPNAVIAGYAPQLAIEALIAQAGGFKDIHKTNPEKIIYYQVSGKENGAEVKEIKTKEKKINDIIEDTANGIKKLITAFYKEGIIYDARPDPFIEFRFSDYEHLERVKEWGSIQGEE